MRLAQRLLAVVVASATFFNGLPSAWAADWPQWRGPQRDGKSPESGLLDEWPQEGPPRVWTFRQAGAGYSGPAIVGDRLFLMGARDGTTELFALDVRTGNEIWKTGIGEPFHFKGNIWGLGPRSTTTWSDGKVYALTGNGDLVGVDAGSGAIQWRTNLLADLGGSVNPIAGDAKTNGWGYTWSPLVDGDQLICLPGGERGLFAAFDKKSGKLLWRSSDVPDQATYSSPILLEVDGVRQYVAMTQDGAVGVDTGGTLLWRYRRRAEYPDVVIPTPVHQDDQLYLTAGYGAGCDLLALTRQSDGTFTTETIYSNKYMKNKLGGVVLVDGHVYGSSERRGWVCQNLDTGRIIWPRGRGRGQMGEGSLVYADGHFYLYSEREGRVGLIEASSEGYREKGRFGLPEKAKARPDNSNGKYWTPPVIAGGKLFLRDQELLFCYDIKASDKTD